MGKQPSKPPSKPLPQAPYVKSSYSTLTKLMNLIGKTMHTFGVGSYVKPLAKLLGYKGPLYPGLKQLKIPTGYYRVPFYGKKLPEIPLIKTPIMEISKKTPLASKMHTIRNISPEERHEIQSIQFYRDLPEKYMEPGFGVLALTEIEKAAKRAKVYEAAAEKFEKRKRALFPYGTRQFRAQGVVSPKQKKKNK